MNKLGRIFSFNGRTDRLGYWRLQIPLLLFMAVCWSGGFLLAEATGVDLLSGLGVVALFPVAWAVIALLFRRLHDRNKSGWWVLLFYVTPLMLAAVARVLLDGGSNLYGGLLALAELAIGLWAFVELGLLRGTRGQNRFGPDPRAA
jgi:uncharacterized membrane protein YhaH (DUF805 family)